MKIYSNFCIFEYSCIALMIRCNFNTCTKVALNVHFKVDYVYLSHPKISLQHGKYISSTIKERPWTMSIFFLNSNHKRVFYNHFECRNFRLFFLQKYGLKHVIYDQQIFHALSEDLSKETTLAENKWTKFETELNVMLFCCNFYNRNMKPDIFKPKIIAFPVLYSDQQGLQTR